MYYIKLTFMYHSLFAIGDAAIEYKRDEWAEAYPDFAKAGYGPCIFDTPRNAANFLRLNEPYQEHPRYIQVWTCEAEGVRKADKPMLVQATSITLRNGGPVDEHGWPEGTLMADRVKLTKLLTLRELKELAYPQEETPCHTSS